MSTPVQPHATTGLFAEFAAATSAEWRCEAEAALAGASFEKRLFTPTPEGLTLRPIYFVEDVPAARRTADFPAQADYGRGLRASGYRARSWRIAAQISTPSPREARAAFDAEQVRGLEVLNLAFAPAIYSGGLGLEATYPVGPTVGVALGNLADAEALFRGMDFDKVEFRLEAGAGALPMAAMLFAALDLDDAMLAKMRGVIAADPLGACARFGCQPCSRESIWLQMGALAGWVSPRAPGLAVWEASGLPYADAGANAVEELAFTLATAVEYARALTPRLRGATAATRVGAWALSVGPHFFTEIAKFRAARVLWARALEGSAWRKRSNSEESPFGLL